MGLRSCTHVVFTWICMSKSQHVRCGLMEISSEDIVTSIVKYWSIKFNLNTTSHYYYLSICKNLKRKEGINFFPQLFCLVLSEYLCRHVMIWEKRKWPEKFCKYPCCFTELHALLIHSIVCRLFFPDALQEGCQLSYTVMISEHFCQRVLPLSVLQMVPFFLMSISQVPNHLNKELFVSP